MKLAGYKKLIIKVKTDFFRELINAVTEKGTYGKTYKIIANKIHKRKPMTPIHNDMGVLVTNEAEIERVILRHHFPNNNISIRTRQPKSINNPITTQELYTAAGKMKNGKAAGLDGLPSEVVKRVIQNQTDWILENFNNCLKEEFPNCWKEAKVVLIPKTGKSLDNPSSYRPVCLLSILGKVLDRILTEIITQFLEENKLSNNKPYGFRKGKSTDMALKKIIDFAEESAITKQCPHKS